MYRGELVSVPEDTRGSTSLPESEETPGREGSGAGADGASRRAAAINDSGVAPGTAGGAVGAAKTDSRPRALWRRVGEAVLMVAVAFGLAMLVQAFVVKPYVVPTGSMIPTIQLNDRVLSDRITFHFREPRVGDIVVFRNPMSGGVPLVKRVVAVGGQALEIRNGYLYLDGVRQEEPYLAPERRGTYNWPEYRIPEGALWMMGDNRVESGDSRIFGPVPVSDVLGRAFLVYWPPAHMGRLR